jgi:hypothetical protein
MSPATSPATASTAARAFDPTAALPAGTVLLEASAGTGKTYSITSLVLRLVAEQRVPLDRVLIVTFTRAAAAELRGRVRERLTDAVAGFDRALAGHEPGETDVTREDQVLAHLVREASVLGAQELDAVAGCSPRRSNGSTTPRSTRSTVSASGRSSRPRRTSTSTSGPSSPRTWVGWSKNWSTTPSSGSYAGPTPAGTSSWPATSPRPGSRRSPGTSHPNRTWSWSPTRWANRRTRSGTGT